jgi:hypothetical protein
MGVVVVFDRIGVSAPNHVTSLCFSVARVVVAGDGEEVPARSGRHRAHALDAGCEGSSAGSTDLAVSTCSTLVLHPGTPGAHTRTQRKRKIHAHAA